MLSGTSHVRYDHRSRPTLLHLSCPKCSGRCFAQKPSESEKGVFTGDCNKAWSIDDWKVVCENCDFRAENLSYESLPKVFYQVEARANVLWAWNRDHLIMLLKLLRHESIKDDPYEWFSTYAHKEWLQKKNRSYLIKSIERFLRDKG